MGASEPPTTPNLQPSPDAAISSLSGDCCSSPTVRKSAVQSTATACTANEPQCRFPGCCSAPPQPDNGVHEPVPASYASAVTNAGLNPASRGTSPRRFKTMDHWGRRFANTAAVGSNYVSHTLRSSTTCHIQQTFAERLQAPPLACCRSLKLCLCNVSAHSVDTADSALPRVARPAPVLGRHGADRRECGSQSGDRRRNRPCLQGSHVQGFRYVSRTQLRGSTTSHIHNFDERLQSRMSTH